MDKYKYKYCLYGSHEAGVKVKPAQDLKDMEIQPVRWQPETAFDCIIFTTLSPIQNPPPYITEFKCSPS